MSQVVTFNKMLQIKCRHNW